LTKFAEAEATQTQRHFWLAQTRDEDDGLPLDMISDNNCASDGGVREITLSLSPQKTNSLLRDVAHAYRTRIDDLLLTALLKGFEFWLGRRSLLVALEGHGREELFDDLELTRTVGWFTTLYPVRLNLGFVAEIADELTEVKEQLRAVPQRGIGYGALRFLSGDWQHRPRFQSMPNPEVRFNYLGQFSDRYRGGLLLGRATERYGVTISPRQHLPFLLDVNAFVFDARLSMQWNYSSRHYREETVRQLAEATMKSLEALIAHCLAPAAGGCTPSDFPAARLGASQLAAVMKKLEEWKA
jgi:non-ribosomal peptide synthase protein (TIGR01720 family)